MSSPDENDVDLFKRMMLGVKPLKTSVQINIPAVKKPLRPPEKHTLAPRQNTLSNPNEMRWDVDSLLSYGKQHLAYQQFHLLKHGKMGIQARLDLHGLTRDAAQTDFLRFLDHHAEKGTRCVLIIHGKGGKNGEFPILKNHVAHWLLEHPSVLAFHSAQPKHGGTGAVYVLLKNKSRVIKASP